MVTHSRIFAWKIPWTEEPGGLSPWGRKECDMAEHAHADTHTHTHTSDSLFCTTETTTTL